jgi:hypothetical protein
MTVTVQSTLSSVRASAGRLREAVRELALIAVEDQPRSVTVHLLDAVSDAVLELTSHAELAATELDGISDPRRNAPLAVLAAQAHLNQLGAALTADLATPGRLAELAGFGQGHGRESAAWAGEVLRCVQACQQIIWTDVQPALLGYWEEIIDASPGIPRTPGL